MGNKNKKFNRSRKQALMKDNLAEDRIIKSLEKKLNLKKKKNKSLPKSFISDGLDYLLDVCDEETRKIAADSEKRLVLKSDDESEDESDMDVSEPVTKKKRIEEKKKKVTPSTNKKSKKLCEDSEAESIDESDEAESMAESDKDHNDKQKSSVSKKNKKNKKQDISKKEKTPVKNGKVITVKQKAPVHKKKMFDSDEDISDFGSNDEGDFEFDDEEDFDSENEENFGSEDEDFGVSAKKEHVDSGDSDAEGNSEKDDGVWEDIYGRKRNKDGEIITETKQKYIAPALRLKQLENSAEKNENLLQLKRQMKGLLNKLAESNMSAIISQLDELYMSNSRNDMNQMLVNLMLDSIVAPVLTASRIFLL